ncbi:MAG: hypothetical protein AAGE52_42145, partial [Myxococcota bacterium]
SRDITFQGVIGWYDGLVLPLEEGDNELWFAVSENLAIRGGWGLQAAFGETEGVTLVTPE